MSFPVILHIDDNRDDVLFLHKTLIGMGFPGQVRSVLTVSDAQHYLLGQDAYQDRSQFPLPDLIVCDLKISGPNGAEFIQWLRHESPYPRLQVIVFCSSEKIADMHMLLKAGVADVLVKPWNRLEWQTQARTIAEAARSAMDLRAADRSL